MQERIARFAQAGDFKAVADLHMEALRRDPSDPVHRIGLQVNAQKVLDGLAEQAARLAHRGNIAAAIRNYQAGLDYQNQVAGYGVVLELGAGHIERYARVKNNRAQELYGRGLMLVRTRAYKQAEDVFVELRGLQPDYGDVERQLQEAVYGQAMAQYDAEAWEQAYYIFGRVADFKNAAEHMRECLENGRITIALVVLAPSSRPWDRWAAPQLYASLLDNLVQRRDPFVAYIDPGQVEWGWEEDAGASGRPLAVQYWARVEVVGVERPAPQETERQATAWRWDGSQEEYTTDMGQSRKRAIGVEEVCYTKVSGRKEVRLVIDLQLTQAGSGAIVRRQRLETTSASTVRYAVYEGKTGQLYRNKPADKRSLWVGGGYADRLDQGQFSQRRRQYAEDGDLVERCIGRLAGEAGELIAAVDG